MIKDLTLPSSHSNVDQLVDELTIRIAELEARLTSAEDRELKDLTENLEQAKEKLADYKYFKANPSHAVIENVEIN